MQEHIAALNRQFLKIKALKAALEDAEFRRQEAEDRWEGISEYCFRLEARTNQLESLILPNCLERIIFTDPCIE